MSKPSGLKAIAKEVLEAFDARAPNQQRRGKYGGTNKLVNQEDMSRTSINNRPTAVTGQCNLIRSWAQDNQRVVLSLVRGKVHGSITLSGDRGDRWTCLDQ